MTPFQLDHTAAVLADILAFAQPADAVLSAYLRRHPKLGRQDRSEIAETAFAAIRHYQKTAAALPDPPALPDLPEGAAVKRTQAAYYVGDPGLPDDWMVFFTVITAQDDEDSQALVDSLLALSDAIVQSVRFS